MLIDVANLRAFIPPQQPQQPQGNLPSSVTLTGVWWYGNGAPEWIPQENMDAVAKSSLISLYKETHSAEGRQVNVIFQKGPPSGMPKNPTIYFFDVDYSGGYLQATDTSALTVYPEVPLVNVPDGNKASPPPASSGGHTGAVPITSKGPIRGVPTSERLEARVP